MDQRLGSDQSPHMLERFGGTNDEAALCRLRTLVEAADENPGVIAQLHPCGADID